MKQEQFLDVVSREEAEKRWRGAGDWSPLPAEDKPVTELLGRVLAEDVIAPRDVPGFTRCNVDGFALRAADTYGATEERPKVLIFTGEAVATGVEPKIEVKPGTVTQVATGSMVPRGADAVVMVEDTESQAGALLVRRSVAPGAGITHAGSDIAKGETLLRAGEVFTSRETGVLAALGIARVPVVRRPKVAVLSTGDEIAEPGATLREGMVHDVNGRIVADAVREAGGEALERGIVPDDERALWSRLETSLGAADLVVLSGGTSKGPGDLSYRVLQRRGKILVHGVALKPGKPLVLAILDGKPVVVLPGFPTSAIFTFHEFVAPWIRAKAGLPAEARPTVRARLPRAVTSEIGRTEYDLVHLVQGAKGLVAYPLGTGSGSITTFSRADGFYAIPAATERLDSGEEVVVTLLSPLRLADLVVIGSHCIGLDLILSRLRRRGFTSKVIVVGSTAGLAAAKRAECDVAPAHLYDPKTKKYNKPFLGETLALVPGYGRRQGVISRDGREDGRMINRNQGSGTRALIDGLLERRRPEGYELEVRTHQAVAAAVRSGRAEWGVAIENVARGLQFRFLAEERFDFLVPKARLDRAPVRAFRETVEDPATREALRKEGFLA